MLTRIWFSFVFSFVLVVLISSYIRASSLSDVEARLKNLFPTLQVHGIYETVVPDIYAVYVDGSSVFFYHKGGYIIFGEIWDENGTNIAAILSARRVLSFIEKNGLKPHIVYGSGDDLILFVNPECPYCNMVISALSGVTNRYRLNVYFVPFLHFPRADEIMVKILCSSNPYDALLDFSKHGYNSKYLLGASFCPQERINSIISSLRELEKVNLSVVPVLYDVKKDKIIIGNNQKEISKYLEEK